MGVREVDAVQNSGVNVVGLLSSIGMFVVLVVICVVFYKLVKKLFDK